MCFSLITIAGEQVETLEQFFTELPVLVDQATRHLHISYLNLLEHLFRRLDDSLNVLGFWKNFILFTRASLILLCLNMISC